MGKYFKQKRIEIPKVEKSGDFSNLNNFTNLLIANQQPKVNKDLIQILPSTKYYVSTDVKST